MNKHYLLKCILMILVIIFMCILAFFGCNTEKESNIVTTELSKNNLDDVSNQYSYLITATDIVTMETGVTIRFYLHTQQNISVAIYSSPPTEIRQVCLDNIILQRGHHKMTFYLDGSAFDDNNFYWIKLITPGTYAFMGRDFMTPFFLNNDSICKGVE